MPVDGPIHITVQQYTDTKCTTQQQMNLTPSFQDIPLFDGCDTTKLEDWISDIETAADIVKERHACLAEAKSCGLILTLGLKALQTGKCWDNVQDILHLKLCNANIHTYTSCFMEIQQRDNETLTDFFLHFKVEA